MSTQALSLVEAVGRLVRAFCYWGFEHHEVPRITARPFILPQAMSSRSANTRLSETDLREPVG